LKSSFLKAWLLAKNYINKKNKNCLFAVKITFLLKFLNKKPGFLAGHQFANHFLQINSYT